MPKVSKKVQGFREIRTAAATARWRPNDGSPKKSTSAATTNENKEDNNAFYGLCFIDFAAVWKTMRQFQHHPGQTCSLNLVDFVQERREGLKTTFLFQCRMCRATQEVDAIPEKAGKPNINFLSVLGAASIGCGYSQMNEYHAAMDTPYMTYKTYRQEEAEVKKITKEAVDNNFKKVGEEEAQQAREMGHVDPDGIPTTGVITDGAWSKRSYRTNYNAASGVGSIVGVNTKKLLNIEVLNKCCVMCKNASDKQRPAKKHVCFRNWNGTSTAMEAAAIVKGFQKSLNQHNLKYIRIISDGDSSVMKKLREVKPYGPNVNIEKVECTNHLLRNFCTKLKELSKSAKSSNNSHVSPEYRNLLATNILRLRTAVKLASIKRSSEDISLAEKIRLLSADIKNAPYHVFGEHDNCARYFCRGPKPGENNTVQEMNACGLFQDITKCIKRLVQNVYSLLLQETNNHVEAFNSVVCKMMGGKRVNFTQNGSYQMRCQLAALSFNTKGKHILEILNNGFQSEATKTLQKFYEHNDRKRKYIRKKKNPKTRRQQAAADEDYGAIEELDEEEFSRRREMLYHSLRKTDEEIGQLEQQTRGQSTNPLWKKERNNRITASRFGQVCKKKATTNPVKLVKSLLFSDFSGTRATAYGINHEDDALQAFTRSTGLPVTNCGLFVGRGDEFFLGASPDGLIESQDEDALVEVKCPANLEGRFIAEEAGKKKSKVPFLHVDRHTDQITLKRNHNYYYQVQGQLHITGKKFCYFVVWSNVGPTFIEKIQRDDDFWDTECKNQLKQFYEDCMLPKIVTSMNK